jgi:hypothetical protein
MVVVPGTFDSGLCIALKEGPKIPDYDEARATLEAGLAARWKMPNPGSPAKGMDTLVDVVRGEGRAASRGGALPLWLLLGDDAIANVRDRLAKMSRTIDEWEAVGRRLGMQDTE